MSWGRWGNVSAAVLFGKVSGGASHQLDSTGLVQQVASLFSETLLIGGTPGPSSLGRCVEVPAGRGSVLEQTLLALDIATTERVLVLVPRENSTPLDLVMALLAWPEADAVLPADQREDDSLCAIYRRGSALAAARCRVEAGDKTLVGLHLLMKAQCVSLTTLGLPDLIGRPGGAFEVPDMPLLKAHRRDA
jgi:hypothetical protein